jgi:thymidylate synthase
MGLRPVNIIARDIPDAWFQAVDAVLAYGRQWTVEHGSYEGQKRWELDYVTVHIKHPGARPLVPEMPAHLSHIPPPSTMDYVSEYLPYLMTDQPLKDNESYTYGMRITSQMEAIIERYKRHGFGSNQECIAVARPEDIDLGDPPCLRQIDTRIIAKDGLKEGEGPALHFIIYFRSWDLWGGFPSNLAAIRLMQEYMAECVGVEAGEMIASSKGLHLYDFSWDIAKLRTGNE